MTDYGALREAFQLALTASEAGEVPVGCVITQKNEIIARGRNRVKELKDASAHAEMLALREAFTLLNSERLTGCDIYTTLEPCTMCSGALIAARVRRVVYLAREERLPSLEVIKTLKGHNHTVIAEYHPLAEFDAAALLRDFFSNKR